MCKVVAFLALLPLSVYPSALRAQTTNGSITGRVTDPSKATIAEAKVAAVNTSTNFRYESTTNGAGENTLANPPPGTYRIEVEKPGFKKLVRPDVFQFPSRAKTGKPAERLLKGKAFYEQTRRELIDGRLFHVGMLRMYI